MQHVALYSHDAVGLGHLRRNLAIARALAEDGRRSVLLVTGTREAAAFPLPAGVDVLTLPAFAKDGPGYAPRSLRTSNRRLSALRSTTIRAALEAFDPDVLIADKHPLGLANELVPALERLAGLGRRLVLGLRDVLDDPRTARAEWEAIDGPAVVRELYDDVWVYGDRRVYDVVSEVGLGPEVAAKACYTGYLGTDRDPAGWAAGERALAEADVPAGRLVVCLVGGGEDGYRLAAAFARARIPPGTTGVVVAGPFMPPYERRRLRLDAGRAVRVVDFLPETGPLLERAEAVIAMGGYNTVCELLALGKRALIVPRVQPRREQLIRALRLAAHGAVDMLRPEHADAQALGRWLAGDPAPRARARVDLEGLQRIPRLLESARDRSETEALDAA